MVHLPSFFDNIRSKRCTGVTALLVQCHEWQDDKLIANLSAVSCLCLTGAALLLLRHGRLDKSQEVYKYSK